MLLGAGVRVQGRSRDSGALEGGLQGRDALFVPALCVELARCGCWGLDW